MNDSKELANKGYQQEMRIRCIDYATRVVGKPEYLMINSKWVKQQEDVVKVAEQIYKFVIS
jgi:phenolic acid decarboxylase